MRDAISIVGKTILLGELNYVIENVYFIPGRNKLYIGLQKADYVRVNYPYEDLLPFIIEQLTL